MFPIGCKGLDVRQTLYRTLTGAIAFATAAALAACGQRIELRQRHQPGGNSAAAPQPVELSIGTFGEFGYEDLLVDYHNLHPNVTIKANKTGQGGPYHQQLLTKLASGSGLEDVVAIEEGHLSDVLSKPQLFNNLEQIGPKDVTKDRWLDWKYDAAKAKDGTLIG